ncbi:hypothetical protein BJ138DRAFT_991031, partial [Hygrophoropsis aurantiaca]
KAAGSLPQPTVDDSPETWQRWLEHYRRPITGIPLEGGTVNIRDVRGHLLGSRLGPRLASGSSECRWNLFWFRLSELALNMGLYRELVATSVLPINPTYVPSRYIGTLDNMMTEDVARHLAACGITFAQLDDIQPYGRHWL